MNAFRASTFPALQRMALLTLLLTPLSVSMVQGENIILFIGDGMGFEQVKAAHYYQGAPLSFEEFTYQGNCTTHSANSAITDSAASGTAIATGVKVNNGVISLATPGDGRELETLLEFYQKRGHKTGLITTAYLTHATPAAFAAHEPSRNNTSQIGGDYLYQTRPNLLFGGGGYGLTPVETANAGYIVVTDTAAFNALEPSSPYLAALFGNGYMPYEEDYLGTTYPVPHLTDMLIKALAAFENHPDGFFLMVEAARIDHACHDNKLPEAVHETLELSRAVQAAWEWASLRTDTTILVTADHETGGLVVTKDNGAGQYPSVTWSSRDHTAANVPIYAWGRNAALVSGKLDNTDFFNLLTAENTSSPILSRVSSIVRSETSVEITWTTDVPASTTVKYRLSSDADWTTVSDAIPTTDHTIALAGLMPDQLYHYQVASAADDAQATSAIYTFTPTSQLLPGLLVATGSVWQYNDTGTDLGTAWREPVYDDSKWKSGPAKLGYGDGDEATVISYGPSASSKYPCYYFRHSFSIDNPFAYENLSLRILRDDGAVVYLNGVEVARYNMPSGTITYATYASTAAEYPWDPPLLIPHLLVTGLNVIAVEVHQCNASSSDLALDLELTAERVEPDVTPPTLSDVTIVEITDRSAILTWSTDEPADSWVYYGTSEDLECQTGSSTMVTEHSVQLTGLNPGTLYHYQVSSMDPFGNQTYGLELTFTTRDQNQPPVAQSLSVHTDEDVPVQITLTGTDWDGDSLTFHIDAFPTFGTLSGTPPILTYSPNMDYFGEDSFQYVASDGLDDSLPATVTITIHPVNDPPSAPILTATVGDSLVLLTWSMSFDPENDPIEYAIYRSETGSDYSHLANTTELAYTDTTVVNAMTYWYVVRAMDHHGAYSDSLPVSATPQPIDFNAYVIQNPTVTYGSVQGDYTALHPDSTGAQTLTEKKVGPHGRLDVEYLLQTSADPSQITTMTLQLAVTFPPWDDAWQIHLWTDANWIDITDAISLNGTYPILYPPACVDPYGLVRVRFTDSAAIRSERLDSLSIQHLYAAVTTGAIPNRPPVALDDTASTLINQTVDIDVLANDSDPDGDSLFLFLPAETSAGGLLLDSGDGIVTYTPPLDWHGTDTFIYSISDGEYTDSALVTITVTDPAAIPGLTIHIESIFLSADRAGKNWKTTALVAIADQLNAPMVGATVTGNWLFDGGLIQSGAFATTDPDGVATLNSPTVKANSGTFTFRVVDVQLTDAIYDPNLNLQTEDSLVVP
jgi:alkaline phosphatase